MSDLARQYRKAAKAHRQAATSHCKAAQSLSELGNPRSENGPGLRGATNDHDNAHLASWGASEATPVNVANDDLNAATANACREADEAKLAWESGDTLTAVSHHLEAAQAHLDAADHVEDVEYNSAQEALEAAKVALERLNANEGAPGEKLLDYLLQNLKYVDEGQFDDPSE